MPDGSFIFLLAQQIYICIHHSLKIAARNYRNPLRHYSVSGPPVRHDTQAALSKTTPLTHVDRCGSLKVGKVLSIALGALAYMTVKRAPL